MIIFLMYIMRGEDMQISRLFQIIYMLLKKKSITARELAEHLEVSTRTIYRDIDALCQAGIPVYSSQGKGGGIALMDNFVLDKSLFSEMEQNKILLALQSLSAVGYPELDDVLSKLSSIFQKNNDSWIEIDFSSWGNDKKQKKVFRLLRNSILEKRVIIFSYFSATGEKSERYVEPLKLLFKNSAWYLQGYCLKRMECRTFKITRMTDIHITEKSCTHQNLEEINNNLVLETTVKHIHLNLKISSEGGYRVYDDFNEEDITKNEDGSYIVTASLPEGEWIYNYLLSFGSMLEVIEPQNIRDEITNRLNDILNKYQSNDVLL